MPFKTKDATISFRTYSDLDAKIEDLAERIAKAKWEFDWDSPMRECTSKSGLITQLLAENLTLQEIKDNLEKAEEANDG